MMNMIKKDNKSLQMSLPKEVIESMDKVCETLSQMMGFKITKSMLITYMFNKLLDDLLKNEKVVIEKHKA